jgi:protein-S-isoprenylcysteine O-methyltransferase Ste14
VLVLVGTASHLWANASLARGERRGETAPTALIIEGPYRYVRNPIYLSGVPLLLGTYLLHPRFHLADPLAAIAVMAVFHLGVVASEEPALRARYGSAYADYCCKVPRWIPRLGSARKIDAPAEA